MRYLLIITICIIIFHSILVVWYCLFMDKRNLEQNFYDQKSKAQIYYNEQYQEYYLEPEILPLTPNPITMNRNEIPKTNLPWYFKDGTIRPTRARIVPKSNIRTSQVWPEEQIDSDRVEDQLMFIPPRYQYINAPLKTILLYNNWNNWKVNVGQGGFVPNNCPVNRCVITTNRSEASNVDAIIFRNEFSHPGHKNTDKQVWIMLVTESAYYTKFKVDQGIIYWTATYRHDSDIVVPYGRWAYYNPSITQIGHLNQNYAKNKTKKVAMIVSNCDTDNHRLEYANELGKYISVDIYGKCGQFKTIKSNRMDLFVEMLDRDYKFYLAFENSNCVDYVTGQFFIKGLQLGMLPIVMGGRQEDYERIAPEKSFVHVGNFESPARLAEYLHRLDADDGLYNEYFRWKGTGEFIDTKFFCRLCAMLHDDGVPARGHRNFSDWWSGPGVCEQPVRPVPAPPTAVGDVEDEEDDDESSSQKDSSTDDYTNDESDDSNAD